MQIRPSQIVREVLFSKLAVGEPFFYRESASSRQYVRMRKIEGRVVFNALNERTYEAVLIPPTDLVYLPYFSQAEAALEIQVVEAEANFLAVVFQEAAASRSGTVRARLLELAAAFDGLFAPPTIPGGAETDPKSGGVEP